MEGIFEALFSFVFEIVLETVGEVIGEIGECILSSDFLTYLNNKLPESISVSTEIIALDIQDYKKEIL